jgi:hypothetical protein
LKPGTSTSTRRLVSVSFTSIGGRKTLGPAMRGSTTAGQSLALEKKSSNIRSIPLRRPKNGKRSF